MEGSIVVCVVFCLVFFLLIIGVPIAFSILGGSIIGLWIIGGPKVIEGFFGYSLHHLMANYPIAVAPMFILVGMLADKSLLGVKTYNAFHKLLGSLRGGLLIATTGAAAVFGACSGSSIASAALFSKVALPELRKLGYQEEISLGAIATAGGLATLIPPSIMIVFYGILTNVSIGKVLIAGIIPGIFLSLLIMAGIYIRVVLNPKLAPISIAGSSWREKVSSIIATWPVLAVFLIIVGGIYFGFFTPTEAGAFGASIVFVYALFIGIGRRKIIEAFFETAVLTCTLFILIVGGMMLSKVVTLSGVTNDILAWMSAANLPLSVLWAIFILMYLILGAILDPISMLVLTLPMSFPILTSLGADPIAFGIVVVLLVEEAVITPPIGFNVYVVAAAAGTDPAVAFKGSVLFFFIILVTIIIVILFPGLATWLPSVAYR